METNTITLCLFVLLIYTSTHVHCLLGMVFTLVARNQPRPRKALTLRSGLPPKMCKFIQAFRFPCGHVLRQLPDASAAFCLFSHHKICHELGAVRYIEYNRQVPCPACGNWRPFRPRGRQLPVLNTPWGQGSQNGVQALERRARPVRRPSARRIKEINALARDRLLMLLEASDFHDADVIEWVVRFIASLPEFIHRKRLIAILEPHLAGIFDEFMQSELFSTFARMGAPNVFGRAMSWRRTRHRGRRRG